jgi:3-phytase
VILAVLLATQVVQVQATRETAPVHHTGDAADDPALWIHPTDPALSLVLGDDKNGGLLVYGLDGTELQSIDGAKELNNVDVRYGFPLKGKFADGTPHDRVDLAGIGNETDKSLLFYQVNPAARKLEPAGEVRRIGLTPYGSCMYRSRSGKYYYFVNATSGVTQQWELRDDGAGAVAGTKVRDFDVGTTVEGCVADDVHGQFYIGEENVGIWRYGAEPGDGDTRASVDTTKRGGHLTADVEGLAIYSAGETGGYLLASSQGNNTFVVYERTGSNAYVGTFKITDGAVDGVSDTDGIDVTNVALGSAFPHGLFVAQDGHNTGGNQNYKLVPWEAIAEKFTPPLKMDTTWDPRRARP